VRGQGGSAIGCGHSTRRDQCRTAYHTSYFKRHWRLLGVILITHARGVCFIPEVCTNCQRLLYMLLLLLLSLVMLTGLPYTSG
jgi:hypothetical protein